MWRNIAVIVSLIVIILIWLLMNCWQERRECQADLQECQDAGGGEEAAFQLVIDLDAFGTFIPVSNQFDMVDGVREPEKPPEFLRTGFFAQLGTFDATAHLWDKISITYADGTSAPVKNRSEVQWIDINCGTGQDALTVENARTLVPRDNTDLKRLLHDELDPEDVVLVTIWRSESGMTVSAKHGFADGAHGHDKFVFSSPDGCTVRLWDDLTASTPPDPFPWDGSDSERIQELRLFEEAYASTHGGPHYPPWGTQ